MVLSSINKADKRNLFSGGSFCAITNGKETRTIYGRKIRDGKVRCSFCHKSEDQVRKLIAGPEGVFICDECIGICSEIMEEELGDYDQEDIYDTDINLLKPEEDS